MRLALSTLALPAFEHAEMLPHIAALGVEGIEVAPTHTFADVERGISAAAVTAYRAAADDAGLAIVGLHALTEDRPDLDLFGDGERRQRTLDHLVHLSEVCRDLGGRTLILESRRRGSRSEHDAWVVARDFLEALVPRIERHGTMLCLAPVGPLRGDIFNTARECRMLVHALDHSSFGFHLAASALADNGEIGHAPFAAVRGCLQHFHVDEPELAVIGSTGRINHADLRSHLTAITYRGWVSVVQNHVGGVRGLDAISRGIHFVTDRYLVPRALSHTSFAAAETERRRLIAATIEGLRPAIQGDGGDLELVAVNGHRVEVRLKGCCVSCANAAQTLGGVRHKLMQVLNTPIMVIPSAA